MTESRSFSVVATMDHRGQRVDSFLAESSGTLSRSKIKTLMLEGRVFVRDVPLIHPSQQVKVGTEYRIDFPPVYPVGIKPQAIPLTILYEDDCLLVIDKPAGLVVHPAPGNEDGTLVNALLAYCGDTFSGIGGQKRPGIVHRLDKDTSGTMVIAKSELALALLSAAFANRSVKREYLAVVWGSFSDVRGEFDGTIGRDPKNRKRMAVVSRGGKRASTSYQVINTFKTAVSLVECRLGTGRTHQIRVHMSAAGHPLVGDSVYLRRIPAAARQLGGSARRFCLDFPRQALHAAYLEFVHPITNINLCFRRSLPEDIQHLLDILGHS